MWNTGCKRIFNQTAIGLVWADWETTHGDVAQVGKVAANNSSSIGNIFPWCINSQEVQRKAFRIYEDRWPTSHIPPWRFGTSDHQNWINQHLANTPPLLYVFQKYTDDQIYFIDANVDGTASWNKIAYCQEGPASYADLHIEKDPSLRAWIKAV